MIQEQFRKIIGHFGVLLEEYFGFSPGTFKGNQHIGYADSEALITSRYSLPIQIRMNSKGYFDAINSDQYESLIQFPYSKNQKYKIRVNIDIEQKNYSVYISGSDGEYTMIADKFNFQAKTPSPININKICIVTNSFNYVKIDNHTIESIK